VRIGFDENTPRVVAHVERGTKDVPLIQAIVDGAQGRAALITTDKSMRTRHHERAAFKDTGCIGIVLRGGWNHASMWDRARLSLAWWTVWLETIRQAAPGSLWQCPWSERPKTLRPF
jgi:hypothetical protein